MRTHRGQTDGNPPPKKQLFELMSLMALIQINDNTHETVQQRP